MKKIILLTLIILNSFASATEAIVSTQPQELKVNVKGMVCAFCAQGIEKNFKNQAEVSEVEVSLEKKYVKLKFKQGKSLDQDKITQILKDAGYESYYEK